MLFAKFSDGTIIKAKKISTPDGEFDASKDEAPEGWYLVESESELTDISINGVPLTITRMRAMMALTHKGYYEQVKEAVASVGGDTEIAFNEALDFERDSTFVSNLGAMLGLDSDQIDQLFIYAASIDLN